MSIPSKYDPSKTEKKWYHYWMKNGYFRSVPDGREPYTIVIPPPNVTGVLHMGHMLNNTIQDVLIRKKRMEGKNALWVPGTDHASIATEARVVADMKKRKIKKSDLPRGEFLLHAWEWKEKHGNIILEQLKMLGASCDWSRTRFTMDDAYYESVISVFIDMYEKGYIYRGTRMVNWDPVARTAISDEEVNYREVRSKLYYVRYRVEGSNDWITIATTRPETILGDTAVAVHPADKRFSPYEKKRILVPLLNRPVPLIRDEYVDMEFGTGALKITPAHDENDHAIGLRHSLKSIDILNEDGSLSEAAGFFVGMDRFEARKAMVRELEKEGHLVRVEEYINKIGFSERTDAVIEPRLSLQWFLKMKELARPALENILNDNIRLVPKKFKNTYKRWMENVKDWCISRQLWWGHRIPAYYIGDTGKYVVARSAEEALLKAVEKTGDHELRIDDIRQDEDVLDTWFSSWLWPIAVFDGIRDPDNADFRYYYPTDDLVTAPEILFFWVARMIIAGYEYAHEKPFRNVYLTGIVRDSKRRKMSKSLGNSPEPMELIKKYSADGVRVGMLLCSPAGGDLLYDDDLPLQGRNFGNKIWNAFRLIRQWKVDAGHTPPEHSVMAGAWFEQRLQSGINSMEKQFSDYRISEALMTVYRLFWDDFSSWYLETVKPGYKEPVDPETCRQANEFLEKLLKLLHPFMPFITEEIWHQTGDRGPGECIMTANFPEKGTYDQKIINEFEQVREIVASLRNLRNEKNIPPSRLLDLKVKVLRDDYCPDFHCVIRKLGKIRDLEQISEKPEDAVSFRVRTAEFYVPLRDAACKKEELARLKKELEYAEGFLKSVMKNLDNDGFVNNAPSRVVEKEKDKKKDAEHKILILRERIGELE